MDNPQEEELFLLEGLTVEERRWCWEKAEQPCFYSRGEVIYDRKQFRRALALVLSGELLVYHGRVVMNRLKAGQVVGAAALYSKETVFASRIVAASEASVVFIPQETVSAWIRKSPLVAENYIRFLSGRIRFLNLRLSTLTGGQTNNKLWQYLLIHRDGTGTVRLNHGMSELAEILDMGRSSLYRSLDELIAEGRVVRPEKNIFIVKDENEKETVK